jgi:hypothetical protein
LDFFGVSLALSCRSASADQRARVARRQFAVGDERFHRVRQLEQAQRVGDMAAALADDMRDVFLAMLIIGRQRLIAGRLFQRIEIGALHILDDRKLERLGVADVEQHDRHFMQACTLRGAPAPLAGDDLVAVGRALQRAHDDRLDDAALPDRLRQLREVFLDESAARVARARLDMLDRHAARRARAALAAGGFRTDIAHQRRKATPKPVPCLFGHCRRSCRFGHAAPLEYIRILFFYASVRKFQLATRNSFSRWMISVASRR